MYYDYFLNHSIPVPWGIPCSRLEGGMVTAESDCTVGIPDSKNLTLTTGRRYVVDESVGVVAVVSDFGALGPDVHEFRVEGGRIRRIRSMTVCRPVFNCGLAMPGELGVPVDFLEVFEDEGI